MGVVFRAEDRLHNREVALKCVYATRPVVHVLPAHPLALTAQIGLEAEAERAKEGLSSTLAGIPPPASPTSQLVTSAAYQEAEADQATVARRLALTQEFATLAGLRHPHIVSVLDYGFDGPHPFFTMELLRNTQGLSAVARDPAERLTLLCQICEALVYLHRRGILHRDLKPGNILVARNADGPAAKLLDFGLAIQVTRDGSVPQANLAGTLMYFAPELLSGSLPSVKTDLYALGLTAYELLSGEPHPLLAVARNGIDALIHHIIREPIRLPSIGLPEPVLSIVGSLLSFDPSHRPQDATQILRDLTRIAGRSPQSYSVSVRESHLQTARLVSRGEELRTLLVQLQHARHGKGTLLLIGGESGVGKSRLLDEFRAQALVRGARVLRVQAQLEHQGTFQLFRTLLPGLCLHHRPSDLALSILLPLCPGLPTLLRQSIAPAEPLDPRSLQERVAVTLCELLTATAASAAMPLLVLIDDLQWGDEDSLQVLSRVSAMVGSHPILLVASYRDDERPDLPNRFPDVEVLKLRRLSDQSIAEMVESMLGQPEVSPEFLAFLRRETEGNAFFLVEVMRTLAESAGTLDADTARTLPIHVMTSGVQSALERRLAKLSLPVRSLLEVAAIYGRELDLALLRASNGGNSGGGTSIDDALLFGAEVAILEVQDDKWRFAHDKMRECLLADLRRTGRIRILHKQVAQTILTIHAEPNEQAARLAHHFEGAEEYAQVVKFASIAADSALQQGALSEAMAQTEKALRYIGQTETPLGEQIKIRRMHTQTCLGLLRVSTALDSGAAGLALLGKPLPTTTAGVFWGLFVRTLRWGLSLFAARAFAAKTPRRSETEEFVALGKAVSLALVWNGRPAHVLLLTLEGEYVARTQGSRDAKLEIYAGMAHLMLLFRWRRVARRYWTEAESVVSGASPVALASYYRMGALMAIMDCDWQRARQFCGSELDLARDTGDLESESFALWLQLGVAYFLGNVSEVKQVHADLQRVLRRADSAHRAAWVDVFEVLIQLLDPQLTPNVEALSRAIPIMKEAHDEVGHTLGLALQSLGFLKLGDRGQARSAAQQTLARIKSGPILTHGLLESFAAPAQVFLELWALGDASKENRADAKQALSVLNRFSASFPLGRPRLHLLRGKLADLQGRGDVANQLFASSHAEAQRLGMRQDQQRALEAMKRADPAQP